MAPSREMDADQLDDARELHSRANVRLRIRAKNRSEAIRAAKKQFPALKITTVINEDWDKRSKARSSKKELPRWIPDEDHTFIITGYQIVAEKFGRITDEDRKRFSDAYELWCIEQYYQKHRLNDSVPVHELERLRTKIEQFHAMGIRSAGEVFDAIQQHYKLTDREMDQLLESIQNKRSNDAT